MRRANIICPTSSTSPPPRAARRWSIEGDPYETAGVNSRAELAHLELEWQRRRREQALEEGATLIDPESVWFAYDTKLGRDVTVEPHVVFGPGSTSPTARHPGVQPYRRRDDRRSGARSGRSRGSGPGRWLGDERQGRQFRRGEEGAARAGRQGQSPELHRRRRCRREGQHRRRHHHLQLRRLRQVSRR